MAGLYRCVLLMCTHFHEITSHFPSPPQDLKSKIDNFRELQPMLEDLSNKAIMMPRHWREIMDITGVTFNMDEDVFKLQDVLDANLLAYKEKIEELCLAARKEAEIEAKLRDVKAEWEDTVFTFGEFKNRVSPLLLFSLSFSLLFLCDSPLTNRVFSSSRDLMLRKSWNVWKSPNFVSIRCKVLALSSRSNRR